MITKLKSIVLSLAALVAIAAPAMVPVAVYADVDANVQNGLNCGAELNLSGGTCTSDANASGTSLQNLIRKIINIFSVIVGVIAVVMIIVGGLKYITSGGESSNVSGAKNTIIYAIVGLVVVALAQFIVRFVLSNASTLTTGS